MAETTAPATAAPAKTAPAVAAVDPKAAPAAKAEEATETIKVNGKEMKVTPTQLRTLAQKGAFADEKLRSVDSLRKGTERIVNALKTPEGVLGLLKDKSLGNSPKAVFKALLSSDIIDDETKEDLSRWVYDNVVVQGKKTPEQIENEKKLSDYERLKKAESDRQQAELTKKQQDTIQQVYAAVRAEVTKQIVADKTFPQQEGAIRQVIEKLRVMNKQGAGITPENVTKALGLVKKDFLVLQQAILDADDDAEALISRIGEARALKISKALIARLKAKTAVKPASDKPEGAVREKVTDRIDKKLGRTPQGYHVLDI